MSNDLLAADKLDIALSIMTKKQLEDYYEEVEKAEGKEE